MPQELTPPKVPDVNLTEEPFRLKYDPMTTRYALSLVTQTFHQYEEYRRRNHENRWLVHESLYLGWMPQKFWDGTNVARASLGMPLTFDQVETALPVLYQALFEQSDEWFEVQATPGTEPQMAQNVQGWLRYALEGTTDEYGRTARNQYLLAIKDVLLYGNGGVEIYWDGVKNLPAVRAVDLRDVFMDVHTPSPDVDDARSVILRRLMTVEELVALRNDQRMDIPPNEILWHMAKTRPLTSGDQNQNYRDALRQQVRNVGDEHVPNPGDNLVEVLVYYSKTRIIWVLNRQWVAYVDNNPYDCIPLAFAPCFIVPWRFYGLSIADVQEGNQRYIEALMNARLDELTLAVHPPRVQKRAAIMTPSQERWRPGAVFTAEDAKDVAFQLPSDASASVFPEIQYIELLAERRTGVNSTMQGNPRGGNVNRTATGVTSQQKGAASRIGMVAKHIEDYMIVPSLYKMLKMLRTHRGYNDFVATMDAKSQMTRPVTVGQMSGNYRFVIHGSSRMMTRDQLMQVVGPIMQFMMNGPLIQALQQTGRTIDFDVLVEMVQIATGIKDRFKLVRDITEDEQQAMQQQQDQQEQMQREQFERDGNVRLQMGQMKQETEREKGQFELQKELIKKQPSQGEMEMQQLEMQNVQMAAMSAQQLERIKLEAQREKHRMDMMMKQVELQIKARQGTMDLQQAQRKGQVQMQLDQQKVNNTFIQDAMGLRHKAAENELTLKSKRAEAAMKPQKASTRPKKGSK
jgi:hypothetical protein